MEALEHIERYLEDRMEAEERQAFEQRMSADPAFRKEVEAYGALIGNIEQVGADAFQGRLSGWEQKLKEKDAGDHSTGSAGKTRMFKLGPIHYTAIAASLALLVVIGYFFIAPPSSSRIFKQAFSAYPADLIVRGGQDMLSQAAATYERGAYKESIAHFEQIPSDSPDRIIVAFYQANAELAIGSPDTAIPLFQEVLDSGNINFTDASEWYLALAHLKKGDTEKAKSLLQALSLNAAHAFSKKATAILQKLN